VTAPLPADERRTLRRRVAEVAGTTRCVGPATAARIAGECGGAVTVEHVVRELAEREVRVAELPALPVAPPPVMPAGLLETVAELRVRLSIEVVFGMVGEFRLLDGFALDNGRVIDAAAFDDAERRVAGLTDPRERELREAVLADLRAVAAVPGGTDDVVLWEVVRHLREMRSGGITQQMALRKQAGILHVAGDDGDLIAAALVEEELDTRPPPAPPRRPAPAPRPAAAPGPAGSVPRANRPAAPPQQPAQPGLVPAAPPPAALVPPELAVRPGPPGQVTVTWTVPAGATVALRRADRPPSWRRGATVTVETMRAHGTNEPTAGAVPTRDGRMRRDVAVPADVVHLTALAVSAAGALVGNTVVLSDAAPVRGVQVRRFGPQVRLSWDWPDGAVAAVVTWTPERRSDGEQEPGRTVRCTRRAVLDGGGFRLDVGHGGGTFAVRAGYGYEASQVLAPPVEIELTGEGVPVSYGWRRRPGSIPFLTRHHDLLVRADLACLLPDLVVVEGRDRLPPTAPDEGERVVPIPSRRVEAGETVVVAVDPPERGPSWLVCFVDPASTIGDEIVLQPPSTRELRRR
jgi:hypothetical protein